MSQCFLATVVTPQFIGPCVCIHSICICNICFPLVYRTLWLSPPRSRSCRRFTLTSPVIHLRWRLTKICLELEVKNLNMQKLDVTNQNMWSPWGDAWPIFVRNEMTNEKKESAWGDQTKIFKNETSAKESKPKAVKNETSEEEPTCVNWQPKAVKNEINQQMRTYLAA